MRDGLRVLVTGAASGLGLAALRQLSDRGDRVIGVDLPGDARAAAVEDAGARFAPCDVSRQDDWASVSDLIRADPGSLDVAFLNAGIMTRRPEDAIDDDPLTLVGSAGYRNVFAVNVDGVAFGVAALAPVIERGGAIVVTASEAGLTPLPLDPFYSMSKHALVGLVRSMAPPLAERGIRINALCPGGVDTAIVPHAVRTVAADQLRPAGDIATSLVALAAVSETGGIWLPGGHAASLVRYETPAV